MNSASNRRPLGLILLFAMNLSAAPAALAKSAGGSKSAPPRIMRPVDSGALIALPKHANGELTSDRDLGPTRDSLPMDLFVLLKPSADQLAARDHLIARQQEPGAAEYHQWLTPQQYGERFGVAQADIAKALAPTAGAYPAAVALTVSGIPSGATYTLTPTSVAPEAGAQTVTLTVSTAAASMLASRETSRGGPHPVSLGFTFPLAGLFFSRRKWGRAFFMLLVVSCAIGLGACSGSSPVAKGQYTLSVTAMSGTVTHSATAELIVN